jgi:hypothetical protein
MMYPDSVDKLTSPQPNDQPLISNCHGCSHLYCDLYNAAWGGCQRDDTLPRFTTALQTIMVTRTHVSDAQLFSIALILIRCNSSSSFVGLLRRFPSLLTFEVTYTLLTLPHPLLHNRECLNISNIAVNS